MTRPWCGSRGYIQVGMRGNVGGGDDAEEAGPPSHDSENLRSHPVPPPLLGGEGCFGAGILPKVRPRLGSPAFRDDVTNQLAGAG